ncbi:hypothetical protein C2845_PMPSC004486 [Panicum miliaceum]|uniref:DUF4283 domain-containing protein n=1 Tax=Panicum miliaceum TaxID=4540 RepID=A0A3L6P9C4_PANMI|nr:hypothetical protein C2845_PMPSC004486 [Panicum miliaceum]
MKKVWKMRGELEVSELEPEAGRKFVLVFSVEGDWKHAIFGGPWQYKMDAFLVEGLVDGDDPSSALFTHVPMALRKELVLADEITGEQVVVQIRIKYNLNLRVLPIHFEFPHTWQILPDEMGEALPQASPPRLWRAPTPASQEQKQDVLENGVVEQVVAEVARLSVVEEAKNSCENNQIAGGGGNGR